MKLKIIKYILSLLLIAGFFGWIFFSGWLNLRLGAGETAVVFSRSSGYLSTLFKSGEFSWSWQAIIPGNIKIFRIPDDSFTMDLDIVLSLPSGEYYSKGLSQESADFSLSLMGNLVYSRDSNYILQSLQEKTKINPSNISFEDISEKQVSAVLTSALVKLYEDFDVYHDYPEITDLKDNLKRELEFQFPDYNFQLINITAYNFPDKELYELASRFTREREKAHQEEKLKAIKSQGEWERSQNEKFALLEEYGKIFQKYPELLEFFSIHNASEFDLISLKSILPALVNDSQEPPAPGSD